jgi:hypothetical protein
MLVEKKVNLVQASPCLYDSLPLIEKVAAEFDTNASTDEGQLPPKQ